MDGTGSQLPSPLVPIPVNSLYIILCNALKAEKKVKLKGSAGFQYKSATRKKDILSHVEVTVERQALARCARQSSLH